MRQTRNGQPKDSTCRSSQFFAGVASAPKTFCEATPVWRLPLGDAFGFDGEAAGFFAGDLAREGDLEGNLAGALAGDLAREGDLAAEQTCSTRA